MTVTCDAAVAARFLEEIRGTPPQRHMIVGLDTEWKMLDGGGFTMALLQLCVGTHVIVFQVLSAAAGNLPEVLKSFLSEEDHIFAGAHIENDVKRLLDDFGVTISNPTDHQIVVPEATPRFKHLGRPHPIYGVCRSSLETIASEVLCLPHLWKPDAGHSRWHVRYLDYLQAKYAVVDAYLSYEVANQLVIRDGYRFK